mgnify:CR=1 FL=1
MRIKTILPLAATLSISLWAVTHAGDEPQPATPGYEAAEKAAQANVIRRREETAATRSLLNTARLMEANPILLRLKELEALEKVTEKVERLTVFGGLDGPDEVSPVYGGNDVPRDDGSAAGCPCGPGDRAGNPVRPGRQDQLGPEGLEHLATLDAHGVGHHEGGPVSAGRGSPSRAKARVILRVTKVSPRIGDS